MKRFHRRALVASCVAILIAACGTEPGSVTSSTGNEASGVTPSSTITPGAPTTSTTEPTKVTYLAGDPTGLADLGVSVALGEGFFQQLGIDLEIQQAPFGDSTAIVEGVISGAAQFGEVGAIGAIERILDGAEIQAVSVLQGAAPSLYSAPGSEIRAVADLRGRRVGIGTESVDTELITEVLATAGLTTNDLDLVSINNSSDHRGAVVDALEAREVDVIFGNLGIEIELASRAVEYTALRFDEVGAPLAGGFLIANSRFATENPGAVTSFLAAMFDGIALAFSDYDSALEHRDHYLSEQRGEALPVELTYSAACRIGSGFIGVPTEDFLAAAISNLVEFRGVPSEASVEGVYSDEYLPAELIPCELGP